MESDNDIPRIIDTVETAKSSSEITDCPKLQVIENDFSSNSLADSLEANANSKKKGSANVFLVAEQTSELYLGTSEQAQPFVSWRHQSTPNLSKRNIGSFKIQTNLSLPAILKSETISTLPNNYIEEINVEAEKDLVENEVKYSVFNIKTLVVCISFIATIGPLAGNIYIPAIPLLQQKLELSEETLNGSISLFMAVFCVCPLIWGILCDRFGRKIIILFGLCLSMIANTLLTRLGQLIENYLMCQLYCYRALQGIAVSCFISTGCAIIRDLVPLDQRASYLGYFFLGPNSAPIIAPILAGIILSAEGEKWRYLFLVLVIINATGLLIAVFVLPETCRSLVGNGDPAWSVGMKKPNILTPKERAIFNSTKLRIHLGGMQSPISDTETFLELYEKPPSINLINYIKVLKFRYFLLVSFSVGLQFALYYAFAVTFSHQLKDVYKFQNMSTAASYLVPGFGLIVGNVTSGKTCNIFLRKWIKQNTIVCPEKRLLFQVSGIYVSCAGGLLYGWIAEFNMSIAGVFVSSFLIGVGLTWATNASTTYTSQIAKAQTGTAIAIMNAIRNTGAAVSSAIAHSCVTKMGYGWFFTLLSALTCLSSLIVLYAISDSYKKHLLEEAKTLRIELKAHASQNLSTLISNQINLKTEKINSINCLLEKEFTMNLTQVSVTSPSNENIV